MSTMTLSRRDRALLIAARDGRCDLVLSGVPDLRVDGRWFCDQSRAHALVGAGPLAQGGGGAQPHDGSRAAHRRRLRRAGGRDRLSRRR